MNAKLLSTKLIRPRLVADTIQRDELIKRLDGACQKPLTLISAPAGYGKSTLASSWAAQCKLPYAWISLQKSDSEPLEFLAYFLAAVQSLFSDVLLQSKTLLESASSPSVPEIVRYLLNDLLEIQKDFIIVLDDYHLIQTDSPVNEVLHELLKYSSLPLHLVLLTRQKPELPISTMRGLGELTEINATNLRFNTRETASFMSNLLCVDIDEATATLLETKTEGWPVGLRLAGLYLNGKENIERYIEKLSGNSSYIAEYLLAEVFSQLPADRLSLLHITSIFNRFCAPLLHHILENSNNEHFDKIEDDAQSFIKWLNRKNLFLICLDEENSWFRYHHFFQEFLRKRLYQEFTCEQIAELHSIAGEWFAQNYLFEETIEHLLIAENKSAAVQVIIDHRYELIDSSQFARLKRLVEQLPKSVVFDNPLLITMCAFIGLDMGNDEEMYWYTQEAIQVLEKLPPQAGIYNVFKGEITILQSLFEMIQGDCEGGLIHAQEALSEIPENAFLIRSLGVAISSVCCQMMGSSERAIATIKKQLSNPSWPKNIRGRFLFCLTLVHYMDANLAGVVNASRECRRILKKDTYFHTRAFASYFLGAAFYLRNQLETAEVYLSELVDSRYAANPSYVAHAGLILANIYLSQGDEKAVDQILDKIVSYCHEIYNSPTVLATIQAFKAELALRRDDLLKVQQICSHTDFDVRPPLWFFYVPQLTPIRCLLAKGTEDSLKKARAELLDLDGRMSEINRTNVRIETLTLLAMVCYKQGERTASMEYLEIALKLTAKGGWIRIFVDSGELMLDLLLHFTRLNPGQPFAQVVLEACQKEHARQINIKPDTTAESLADKNLDSTVVNQLTRREIEIILLMAEGSSNKEIGKKLFISHFTVKTHLKNIYKKLNAKNRIEALQKVTNHKK